MNIEMSALLIVMAALFCFLVFFSYAVTLVFRLIGIFIRVANSHLKEMEKR